MRVTVDAAMRARDVSRPWDDDRPPLGPGSPEPVTAESGTPRQAGSEGRGKGERRRLGKRHGRG
jgi:hypothetical protein